MSEIHLNKFEKEKRVIELHKEGKTIRAIAPLVHMSFGPISKIIKTYDKKVRLEQTKKDENSQSNKIKKLYNIYIENEFHLDYLFKIYFFMLRNEIPKEDCEIVLCNAHTVINLNNSISNLKLECETWQRVKNNHDNAPLEPLPKINKYYTNSHF
jgi:hypothetical protein